MRKINAKSQLIIVCLVMIFLIKMMSNTSPERDMETQYLLCRKFVTRFLAIRCFISLCHFTKSQISETKAKVASFERIQFCTAVILFGLKGELGELEFYFRKIPLHQQKNFWWYLFFLIRLGCRKI